MSSRSPLFPLLAILALGAGARLALVFALETWESGAGAYEHAVIARHIAQGEGFRFTFFSDEPLPSSHQAPVIAGLLALSYLAFGSGTPAAHLAFELVGVALALAGIAALSAWGSMLWNRRVGLWCAALMALYPPLVYATTRIQSINWSIPWLLVTLAALAWLARSRSFAAALLAGLSAGLGILGDPILAAPLGLAGLSAGGKLIRADRSGWRLLAAAGAAALLVLLPWTVRNQAVHERVIPVKDSFWYVFWQGNNPRATGTDKLEPDPEIRRRLAWRWGGAELEEVVERARRQAVSVDSTLAPEDIREIRSRPSEVEKMDWFRARSLENLAGSPARYARLSLRRLGILLWFDPTNPRAYVLPYRLPYLALAALAVAGLVLWRRHAPRGGTLWLAALLGLVLVFTLVITSARFRLIIEALLILPAGLALERGAAAIAGKTKKAIREGTEEAGERT